VPGCSAQRELRPPRIAVNTSGNAVCSCAQDFALILFFGRGMPRNAAEERGKSHGYVSFQCSVIVKPAPVGARLVPSRGNQWRAGVFGSAGASPSHDRSEHLWQCSLQLCTGFRADPFFLAAEERGMTRKIAWVREFSVFSNRKAPPLGASPSEDRSEHLWQCSLQLRTGFRVDPFFGRGRTRNDAE